MPGTDQSAQRNAVTLGAAAVAAPALAIPLIWPLVVLALRVAVGTLRRANDASQTGSSTSALSGTIESGLRKARTRAIPGVANGLITLVIAVVVVAVASGVPWLAVHGTDGVLVATRLGLFAHAMPVFSGLACWRIARGQKGKGGVVDSVIDRFASTPNNGLALASGGCALVVLLFVLVIPTAQWAPWGSFESAVSTLPPATRDSVFALRSDAVSTEAQSVLSCLASKDRELGWTSSVMDGEQPGTLTVAIRREPHGASTREDVTTLVLALDNQLPRGVIRLSVRRVPNRPPLVIDRGKVAHDGPRQSVDGLAAAANVRPEVLPLTKKAASLGLRCGAVAL